MRPSHHFDPLPRVARLFGTAIGEFRDWENEEFRAILLQQLEVPIKKWLKPNPSLFNILSDNTGKATTRQIITVHDLLECDEPPLTYLRRAKEVAKSAESRLREPLPAPVAMALYYSVIAVAIVKCNERITEMDDKHLVDGLRWVTEQLWIEETLRKSTAKALSSVLAE